LRVPVQTSSQFDSTGLGSVLSALSLGLMGNYSIFTTIPYAYNEQKLYYLHSVFWGWGTGRTTMLLQIPRNQQMLQKWPAIVENTDDCRNGGNSACSHNTKLGVATNGDMPQTSASIIVHAMATVTNPSACSAHHQLWNRCVPRCSEILCHLCHGRNTKHNHCTAYKHENKCQIPQP